METWKRDFSDDVILRAIGEAVSRNARNVRYVDSILVSWKIHGVPPTREERVQQRKNGKNGKSSYEQFVEQLQAWVEADDGR